MEYDKISKSFVEFTNQCRSLILSKEFTIDDAFGLNVYNNDNISISDKIKNQRLKMINIKFDHTMRMVEQVIKINENLGFKIDLALVIKVAVLFHDVGRMRQATWSNVFADGIYRRMSSQFNNHGEDGYDIFLNNDFNVDDKYVPVIGETIKHHQDLHMFPILQYRYDTDLSKINIDDIITGKFNLNEAEWQITSLIVQLVADLDKTDILYQQLSDDSDMIREYVNDSSMNSLDEIANYWCVSKEEIIEYNKIDEVNYKPRKIRIPIKHMSIDKLEVPKYMKEMFYNDSWPELSVLVQDKNWNFICILWWRLSHFLNQISFSSTLINIEESKLLERMYELIPDKLKPLVSEAFEYAQDVFVYGKIEKNKGYIYLR